MAKISTYPNVEIPSLRDIVIGTDINNARKTVNFKISDILSLNIAGITVITESRPFNEDDANILLVLDGTDVVMTMPEEFPFASGKSLYVYPLNDTCGYQDKFGNDTIYPYSGGSQDGNELLCLSTVRDGDITGYLNAVSSAIIYDNTDNKRKTAIRYLMGSVGDYATEAWVLAQGYITSAALIGYATESWVLAQNYLTSADLSGYATVSWVLGQGYITLSSLSAGTGISYNTTTGQISNTAPDQTVVLSSGADISISGTYPIFTITNTAPDQIVILNNGTGISVSGTYPNFTVTNTSPSSGGTVTSVGLSMPAAFSVTNSPVTGSGTLTVSGAGVASQYVRGDGTLANFPTGGGGGSSVSYYLNGGTSQGTFVGNTYYQMSKTAVVGTNADFSTSTNGYIAQFITDAGDPSLLNIPAGNWNFELFLNSSSSGGSPSFYIELYKYNGSTFTLIASNSATPEGINNGTAIDLYTTELAVPATSLTISDRLAVRVYVNTSGRTITLHTQDSHLCQIITTFTTGLTALNGLTAQVQYLATGTSGTDFNIVSSTDTHTLNLPVASSTKTGKLSSTDWSIFNGKQDAITLTTTGSSGASTFSSNTLNVPTYTLAGLGGVPTTRTLTINGTSFDLSADRTWTISGAAALSAITAAAANNTISNTSYNQIWQWTNQTGSGLKLSNTSSTPVNNSVLLELESSGAPSTTGNFYAQKIIANRTGTNVINYGLDITHVGVNGSGLNIATGGTAINIASGATNGLSLNGSRILTDANTSIQYTGGTLNINSANSRTYFTTTGTSNYWAFNSSASANFLTINRIGNGNYAIVFNGDYFSGNYRCELTSANVIKANGGSLTFTGNTGLAGSFGSYTPTDIMTVYGTNSNVGIGTTTPNSSAALEISSTTKGLLLPRMTTTQRNAISTPTAGLVIFNTTTTKMEVYDGTTWQQAW